MSKSSATDQHGNWRTVPEVQPKDEIRVRAEEAASNIETYLRNSLGIQIRPDNPHIHKLHSGDIADIVKLALHAALAEKEAEIAELVGAVKNFLANRYSLNAEMDLEKILAKHAKPTVTT